MKKIMIICAICAAFGTIGTGCRSVEVENYGEEIARDADDKPVTLADGKIQTVKKGWKVKHNQHWMSTQADTINASVRPEEIIFTLNGLNSYPDASNLVALVRESLTGCAELAIKIGTAIATCGGSVAAEGGAAAIATLAKQAYAQFRTGGGDESKASITQQADGTIKVSDGTICTTCKDGTCTTGNCSTGTCTTGNCSDTTATSN